MLVASLHMPRKEISVLLREKVIDGFEAQKMLNTFLFHGKTVVAQKVNWL